MGQLGHGVRLGGAAAESADAGREEGAEDEGQGGEGGAESWTGHHGGFLLLMTNQGTYGR